MTGLATDVLVHFFYWLDLWLIVSLAGLLLFAFCLIPASLNSHQSIILRWRRSWGFTIGLLLVNSLMVFYIDLVIQLEVPGASQPSVLSSILAKTHHGQMAVMRFIALLVLGILSIGLWSKTPSRRIGLGALSMVGVLVFTVSATSHVANQGVLSATLLAHWLHIVAAMAWGGVILGFCTQLNPLLSPEYMTTEQVIGVVRRVSRIASFASALTIIMGLVIAFYFISDWEMWFGSEYGRRLLIKVLFVVAALGVALNLRMKIIPLLKTAGLAPEDISSTVSRLKKWFLFDRLLVALTLLMALDLAHQIPPVDLAHGSIGPE